jgi:hypothetical protein
VTIRPCVCGSGIEARWIIVEDAKSDELDADRSCPLCLMGKIADRTPPLNPKLELRIRFDNSDGAYDEKTGATVR